MRAADFPGDRVTVSVVEWRHTETGARLGSTIKSYWHHLGAGGLAFVEIHQGKRTIGFPASALEDLAGVVLEIADVHGGDLPLAESALASELADGPVEAA